MNLEDRIGCCEYLSYREVLASLVSGPGGLLLVTAAVALILRSLFC